MAARTRSGTGTEDGDEAFTDGAVAGCGISVCRPCGVRDLELAARRPLERPGDDVRGVRVVAEVVRDRVDGVSVAREVVDAVDAAVVLPVRKNGLGARSRCCALLAAASAASAVVSEGGESCGGESMRGRLLHHEVDRRATIGRVSTIETSAACAKRKRCVCCTVALPGDTATR